MMELKFIQIYNLIEAIESLQDKPMPFKLSLILAKNLSALNQEKDFYLEREREFFTKFLQFDEKTGEPIENKPGVYAIKTGMEQECMEARKALDDFTVNIELRKIPVALIENLDFTPKQLVALELIIEEE